MQELYHRIFPRSLVPAHIFPCREGILGAPPDPGCFPQAPMKQQEAKGPRALPSPCKDYQLALVTTNLLPSPSFLRILCLGAVAGLRLLCCYLFRLPTKEITGDWQAAPHSIGFGVFCRRLFVLWNSTHQALACKSQTHGGRFLNLKGRHKSFVMRSGVVF